MTDTMNNVLSIILTCWFLLLNCNAVCSSHTTVFPLSIYGMPISILPIQTVFKNVQIRLRLSLSKKKPMFLNNLLAGSLILIG